MSSSNTVTFNLNSVIQVRLNNKGFEHWKEEHEKFLPEKYHHELSHYKNKMNEAGYIEFQAWHFMEIFGSKTGLGCPQLFHCEILLKTENLEPYPLRKND